MSEIIRCLAAAENCTNVLAGEICELCNCCGRFYPTEDVLSFGDALRRCRECKSLAAGGHCAAHQYFAPITRLAACPPPPAGTFPEEISKQA